MSCVKGLKEKFETRMKLDNDDHILFLIEAHQTHVNWRPGGRYASVPKERIWRRQAIVEGLRRGLITEAPELQR